MLQCCAACQSSWAPNWTITVCAFADLHRPRTYSIEDIEDTSPVHGLSHKTISGMHHHGTKQLEVIASHSSWEVHYWPY